MSSQLLAASVQIESTMETGMPTRGRTGATIERVESNLKSTLSLFQSRSERTCIVTSPLEIRCLQFRPLLLERLAQIFQIPENSVFLSCDHNHSVPCLAYEQSYDYEVEEIPKATLEGLTPKGRELLDALEAEAKSLEACLQPVSLEVGTALEQRVAYNRKGQWPNGSHYFIREPERLALGDDYTGTIDPEADVVVFRGENGKPVLVFARYTAHPVTAYHPEHMMAYGDWPQLACDRLREHMGDPTLPVGFLQGCAGNINSRYFLSGDLERSRELGAYLGDSFIQAYETAEIFESTPLKVSQLTVGIPFAPLPAREFLERDLGEIRDFIESPYHKNEYGVYDCVGQNLPEALSPPYRAALAKLLVPWYEWALDQVGSGNSQPPPRELSLDCPLIQFGGLALLGLPFEPFVETGELLKKSTSFKKLLPVGYVARSFGYISDAAGVGDREYMSSFYRFTPNFPPFAKPAGDAVVEQLEALFP